MPFPLRAILATILLPLVLFFLFACNCAQLLSFIFLPISPWLTRQINRFCCGYWFNFLCFSLQNVLRVEFRESGVDLPRHENAFFLANHQAMADIPTVLTVARRRGRCGDAKWFVKDPLKWVPGIGWGLLMVDCLFVRRNWAADKARVMGVFNRLRESGMPFLVMSFLEGTRYTPAKYERSLAFARRQGLPEFKHLLLPRTKGFEATLTGLEGKVDAVYDATIGYFGPPPGLLELFYSTRRVDIHLKRFAITTIPTDDAGRAKWAIELFREKDALLERHSTTGAF